MAVVSIVGPGGRCYTLSTRSVPVVLYSTNSNVSRFKATCHTWRKCGDGCRLTKPDRANPTYPRGQTIPEYADSTLLFVAVLEKFCKLVRPNHEDWHLARDFVFKGTNVSRYSNHSLLISSHHVCIFQPGYCLHLIPNNIHLPVVPHFCELVRNAAGASRLATWM